MPEQTALEEGQPKEKWFKVERRAWVRFPCSLETSCHPVTAPSGTFHPARVQDISVAGLALILGRRFEPGTLLTIILQGAEQVPHSVTVRVIHDTLLTAHPSLRWLVGCTFLQPLRAEEVWDLLG